MLARASPGSAPGQSAELLSRCRMRPARRADSVNAHAPTDHDSSAVRTRMPLGFSEMPLSGDRPAPSLIRLSRSPAIQPHGLTAPEGDPLPDAEFGPVSDALDGGSPPGGAPAPPPAKAPTPPVAAPAPPAPAPAPPAPCTLTTKTVTVAPNGAANTRTTVGVNEQVRVSASTAAAWTASSGTLSTANGAATVWTAPETGGASTITATPASGAPCSVTMTTIAPTSRSLTKTSDVGGYAAANAGSAFVAKVTIKPTNVSFSRIEVREESVNAVATGYYDTSLHWNGMAHPQTASWLALDANNSGLQDTVGTQAPGAPPPFSAGQFRWAIPQSYRIVGGATVTRYSTANHVQTMGGASGAETTSKEGASRSRTPTPPPPAAPAPAPAGP